MIHSIIKRGEVLGDLLDIAGYIAQDSVEGGFRFLDAAQEQFESIAQYPEAGTRREDAPERFPDLRSTPIKGFRNYLVFYQPSSQGRGDHPRHPWGL